MKQIFNFLMVIAITLSAFSVASAAPTIKQDTRQPISIAQHAHSHVITVTDFAIEFYDLVAMDQPVITTSYCNFITPEVTTCIHSPYLSVKKPDKKIDPNSYIIQENIWTYRLNIRTLPEQQYRRQGINCYKYIDRNIRYNLSHDYGLSC